MPCQRRWNAWILNPWAWVFLNLRMVQALGNWGVFYRKTRFGCADAFVRCLGAGEFAISEVPETDWVAKVKRELQPVVAGQFFVYGSHDADKVPADANRC